MKTETIHIERVDAAELERHRLLLGTIALNDRNIMSHDQANALEGVMNMLDEWSDKRHFQENRKL